MEQTTKTTGESSRRELLWAAGAIAVFVALAWELVLWEPTVPLYEGVVDSERLFFDTGRGHPLIGLAVCVGLIWRRRSWLASLTTVAGYGARGVGAVVLFLACAARAWSSHTGATDLQLPALALLILGLGVFADGVRGARRVGVLCLVLILAMPIPAAIVNIVMYPMQNMTASGVSFLLDLVGVEHVQIAEQIRTSAHLFYVIEGCAGLSTLQTMALATVVYFELLHRRGTQWIVLLIAAPTIAIGINQLRVITIVLMPESGLAEDHTSQGLVMIVLGVVLLAVVDAVHERFETRRGAHVECAPVTSRTPATGRESGIRLSRVAATGAILLYALAGLVTPRWVGPEPELLRAAELPLRLGDWRVRRTLISDREFLGTLNGSDQVHRLYDRPGVDPGGDEPVEVLVLVDDRRARHQNLFSEKAALPGPGYRILARRDVAASDSGRARELLEIEGPRGRELVMHWCEMEDGPVIETLRSVLAFGQSRWRHERPIVSVRASLPERGKLGAERDTLIAFSALLDSALIEMGISKAP